MIKNENSSYHYPNMKPFSSTALNINFFSLIINSKDAAVRQFNAYHDDCAFTSFVW